ERKIRLRAEHHRELTISGREASAADRNLTFAAIGLSSTWSVRDEQKAVQILTASQIAGMFLAASTCRVPVVTKEPEMRLHPISNCVSHVLVRSSSAAYLMHFAVADRKRVV